MLTTDRYRRFISGRYFGEGIRMAVGISTPAFICGYFGMLAIGVVMSLGALCASVTDSAGPVRHRVTGMLFCIALVSPVSIITYASLPFHFVTGAWILIAGFAFSMLSVYNARVASVGIAALLIMVLSLQTPLRGKDILLHAVYLLAGGTWYLLFSLALHTIRPYKVIRQLAGEFILGVASYLEVRALFYSDHPDYDDIYRSLLQKQSAIRTQQEALREMLFKTRAITKNSTQTGRNLLKIFLDVSDLFESIMSAYREYGELHRQFDETGILELFRGQLLAIARELEIISRAVTTGVQSRSVGEDSRSMAAVRQRFEELRREFMTDKNLEDFISLGRICDNIDELTEKTGALHYYTGGNGRKQDPAAPNNLDDADAAPYLDPALFTGNLNFTSGIFRHSLRVACSLFVGYLASLFFNIGHSYWILLTIVVILKPAYSLSRNRNRDRLFGTAGGILIGAGLLFIIKNEVLLLATMFVFMSLAYMFPRTRYFISVVMMTIYLVIFFQLIYPGHITAVLSDRLLDTFIGSMIAFAAGRFFIPAWEHAGIRSFMSATIEADINWLNSLTRVYTGLEPVRPAALRKYRRQALTALANLTDAFNRMLSEPKKFQRNAEGVYRFVVLNHILSSHFSTLALYLQNQREPYRSESLLPIALRAGQKLQSALGTVTGVHGGDPAPATGDLCTATEADELLAQRRREVAVGRLETATKPALIRVKSVTDQFMYIDNLAEDIRKTAAESAVTTH